MHMASLQQLFNWKQTIEELSCWILPATSYALAIATCVFPRNPCIQNLGTQTSV